MADKPYDPPFSLRLSFEERARLETLAEGQPLSSYIRERLRIAPPKRRRASVQTQEALVRLLGLLGQSRIASNLNQLAKAANSGSLPVTPETEAALQQAAADISAMRRLLLQALGLEASPP